MTKVIHLRKFNFFKFYKSKLQDSVKRLNQTIENPDSTFQAKIEAKMVRSILEFDDAEFERTTNMIKSMQDKKIRVIE